MNTTLDLVYRYRNLTGRCELGAGLDIDEIEALLAIEAQLGCGASVEPGAVRDAAGACAKASVAGTANVNLPALLRNRSLHDEVQMVSLGPRGCVVSRAPYAHEGDVLEVMVDQPTRGLSYRFKARVLWLLDDEDDDFALGLAFVGTPLLIHYGPPSTASAQSEPASHKVAA